MASKFTWLASCKASELRALASSTGLLSSGTKAVLASRLLRDLQLSRFAFSDLNSNSNSQYGTLQPFHNIISIDMGIRNLAYCRFILPENPKLSPPIIAEWTRIAISRASSSTEPNQKEAFDPATYSQHAYTLITSLLSSNPPTQILIERQRFRSMGGSSVQEWTLRVNMFEAMLYAVLKTLSAQGVWSGTVHPVVPGKVSQFWLGNAEELTGSGSRSAKTKVQKVELVRKWLAEEGMLQLEGEAKELGRKYLKKMEGGKNAADKPKRKQASQMQKSQAVGAEIGKLDDLADCLLQGMAWIRWEENRQAVISKGLAALNSFA